MRRITFLLLVGTLLLPLQPAAQSKGDVALRAAIETEIVKGDVKAAIEQYKKLSATTDRAIAAQALLHMAECYQKLGDAQARQVLERIVREFADQQDAATLARARLANNPAAAVQTIVTRQLWSVPPEALGERTADGLGTVSPDGRYFSFVDWSSGNLFLHDFTTRENRRLTDGARNGEFAEESVISRDGAQVAYAWFNMDAYELRTLDLNAKGAAPRVLFANHRESPWVFPYDWSPDGKWIAVQIRRADGVGQLALVSTTDGALRVLESSDWRRASGIAFSPDSRFLAYDIAADGAPGQHDIYVIAADAHQKVAAVADSADEAVIGWTPDGGHLLFTSDRSGTNGVWVLPVADGKRLGEPRLIKADVRVKPRGIARSGALYFSTALSHRDIYVASVDFDTGRLVSAPVRIAGQTVGFNVAAQWSPNGESLAYLPRVKDASTIAVQSITTGRIRELRPDLAYVFDEPPLWSPDGRFLVVVGPDQKGRWGLRRVDAANGDTTLLVLSNPPASNSVHPVAWSPDGQVLYLRRIVKGSGSEIVAFDMRTQHEELIRRVNAGLVPSPDGSTWAAIERSSGTTSLRIESAGAGPARTAMQVTAPEELSGFDGQGPRWSPDSRFVVVRGGRENVWAVPAGGGSPRKLDLAGMAPVNLQIHPDRRRVAIETAEQKVEVWVMENLMTAASAKK